MGYRQTTIVVYGVELSNDQAEKIYNENFVDNGEMVYDKVDTQTSEVAYVHRIRGNVYKNRNTPAMFADGADSRIHDLAYSVEAGRHVFGIEVASRGSDKIEKYLKNTSPEAIRNYHKYILPILQLEGIATDPEIFIVTQVH
jgi:hypothetical protein